MRRSNNEPEDLSLFSEDDLGPDHTATNKMMDNRVRLDQLGVREKARLAEALVAFDVVKYIADGATRAEVEAAYQDFLSEQLDRLCEVKTSGCHLCHNVIDPEGAVLIRVVGWVHGSDDKKVRSRTETGDIAHEHCVDRVTEGGDPGTKPMF